MATKVPGYALAVKIGDKIIAGLMTTGFKEKPTYEEVLHKEHAGVPDEDIDDSARELSCSGQTYRRTPAEADSYEDYETIREAAAAGSDIAFSYYNPQTENEYISGVGKIIDFGEDANSKDTGTYSFTIKLQIASWSSYWKKQLSRNTDEVLCSGYYTVDTAGTNLNLTTSDGAVTLFCQRNNLGVIRQTGLVTKVKFYAVVDPTKALESFLIMFFRKDGDNYDRIGYEDVVSQVTATGIHTVTLTTPISVRLGDYVVIGGNRGTSATSTIKCKTGYTAGNRYADFVWYPTSPNQDYAWDSATQGDWIIPVQCYMQAPLVAIIGDSLTAGHGTGPGGSFIENTNYPATTKLIGYSLYAGNSKYICQDMGIGAQATTAIAARFAADVVALKPKIAIIEGGVNDIALGTVSKATFIANMTAMLNACLTNDILPVVCKILPWTNGTEGQMQTRDEWMTDLKALVESATYNGAVWVDFDTAIGKNRVGGDEGNLWDIQTDPDYDDDGVHLTLLGYQKMAEVINAAIVAKGYVLV